MKSFLELFENILDGRGFIRPHLRFKDGVWTESGWIAYAVDYDTRPIPLNGGALFWTARGETKDEAISRLAEKI